MAHSASSPAVRGGSEIKTMIVGELSAFRNYILRYIDNISLTNTTHVCANTCGVTSNLHPARKFTPNNTRRHSEGMGYESNARKRGKTIITWLV